MVVGVSDLKNIGGVLDVDVIEKIREEVVIAFDKKVPSIVSISVGIGINAISNKVHHKVVTLELRKGLAKDHTLSTIINDCIFLTEKERSQAILREDDPMLKRETFIMVDLVIL